MSLLGSNPVKTNDYASCRMEVVIPGPGDGLGVGSGLLFHSRMGSYKELMKSLDLFDMEISHVLIENKCVMTWT